MSMKKTIKLFSLLVLTSLITTFSFAQEVDYTKKIINKWKMIKTEENGQDIQPKHDKLILDIQKKNNVFIYKYILKITILFCQKKHAFDIIYDFNITIKLTKIF